MKRLSVILWVGALVLIGCSTADQTTVTSTAHQAAGTGTTLKPAVTTATDQVSTTVREKQPSQEWEWGKAGVVDDPRPFLAEKAKAPGSGPLAVPVYREEVLLGDNDRCFGLGLDAGLYSTYGSRPDSFEHLQAAFPSEAIRRSEDGASVYVMYDTDRGSRLYVFFSEEKAGYMFADGFPILMKKKLAHEDFGGLSVGDSLEKVLASDPVVELYRRSFEAAGEAALARWSEMGVPPTSVHLLADGVLKITYERRSPGDYRITSLVYGPDFVLEGLWGETCYRIDEADYR